MFMLTLLPSRDACRALTYRERSPYGMMSLVDRSGSCGPQRLAACRPRATAKPNSAAPSVRNRLLPARFEAIMHLTNYSDRPLGEQLNFRSD